MVADRDIKSEAPTNARSFRNLLDSHPFFVLMAFLVSTAAITGGVVQWNADVSSKLLQQKYEYTINNLKSRLASIRIGSGTDDLLLSVADMQMPSSKIRSLSTKYSSFNYNGAPGRFYVSVPEFVDWSRRAMTSMDLIQERIPDISILSRADTNALTRDKWVVWQSPQNIEVSVQNRQGDNVRMVLAPFVAVGKISYTDIEAAIKDIDNTLSELQATIEQGLRLLGVLLGDDSPRNSLVSILLDGDDAALSVDRTMDLLSILYSSDVAAHILNGQLSSGIATAALFNGTYNLQAIERKGNVLYLQSITRLSVEDDVNGSGSVYLVQDYLSIGVGDHIVQVLVNVPSRDLTSDAYAWTRAWLASLRIPIEPKSIFRSQVD